MIELLSVPKGENDLLEHRLFGKRSYDKSFVTAPLPVLINSFVEINDFLSQISKCNRGHQMILTVNR